MCIKLMLKYPNLYYATSAFAPKYLPPSTIEYANSRSANKILYAGYWPILSYTDIVSQLHELRLKPSVWPQILAGNARRVFGIGSDSSDQQATTDRP